MRKYGDVLKSIHPEFKKILEDLINNNPLNFESHDEGNYDVDRMDYLLRDALYRGKQLEGYTHEQYHSIFVAADKDGSLIKSDDGSLMTKFDENVYAKKKVDVYPYKSLKPIEQFLERRVETYKDVYFSDKTQVSDFFEGKFINYIADGNFGNEGKELRMFINQLRKDGVNIDLNEFLKWDDIKFYNCCMDVGEHSNNENLRNFAGMVIPHLRPLMNLTYSHLDLKNAKKDKYNNLSEEDKAFISKIKDLIGSNDGLGRMLKEPNYYENNCLTCSNEEKIKRLKNELGDDIYYADATVYGYKNKVPVYVQAKDGKVYELNEHPERSCDWSERKEKISVAFCAIPQLKLDGMSDERIDKIKKAFCNHENPDVERKQDTVIARDAMEDYFDI